MARAGSADIAVEFDDSGGTPRVISQYVTEISGLDSEAKIEETTAMGDANVTQAPTGFKVNNDVTLGGFYDDVALGPNALFIDVGNTTSRTLKVTWKTGKTSTVETIIKKYSRKPTAGGLTKYQVHLAPTGPIVEV